MIQKESEGVRKLKIALCDDDKNCRDLVKKELKDEKNIEIFEYRSGAEIVKEKEGFDLIFMDVEMPGENGISTAIKIREKDSQVDFIFISSYPEYAIDTFQLNTFWFIQKPVESKDLKMVFDKFLEKRKNQKTKITLKRGTEIVSISISEIYYIHSSFKYLRIYTKSRIYEEIEDSLKSLEEKLIPYDFVKNDRSFLTNMEKIEEFTKDTLVLDNQQVLKISSRRKKEVAMTYGAYLRRISL